jgi:topoisomerase IA-like protein
LKYPIIIKAPNGNEKDNIQICKGKSNYYLKTEKGTVSLTTDNEEPKPMSYEMAKEIFDSSFQTKESKTLREIDKDINILSGPYGPYISYKGKLNVAIPKKMDYNTITRDECATLINKKKEDKKNGVKPKVFRKFTKK